MTAYWPVPAVNDTNAYSHFRVVLTGKDSSSADWLRTSCNELYGDLLD